MRNSLSNISDSNIESSMTLLNSTLQLNEQIDLSMHLTDKSFFNLDY